MICLPQQIKGGRIAEEVRDVDEEVLGEQLALTGILAQDLQIARAALDARHRHAPLDPALQRALACRARNRAGSLRPTDQ